MSVKQEEKEAVAAAEQTQEPVLPAKKTEVVRYDTDFSKGIFGSTDNFMMATQMAKAFAESTIVPKEYQGNFANGLVAIEMANRMQTSPLMVMQGLDVIQGRPAWRSQFLIGMVNSSGKYDIELQFEETRDKDGKPFGCTCWNSRGGRKVIGPEVTMDMAREEKWVERNGSKWKTMPQIMLRYRAASFFVSMNCPELKFGLYTREEIIDIGPAEHSITDMTQQVKREIEENANAEEFSIPQEPEQQAIGKNETSPTIIEAVGKRQDKAPLPMNKYQNPGWA